MEGLGTRLTGLPRKLFKLPPVIDELTTESCGESLTSKARRNTLTRRREIEATVLQYHASAVVYQGGNFSSDTGLIEIIPDRVVDPLAVLRRAEGVAAIRRFGGDCSVEIPEKQV